MRLYFQCRKGKYCGYGIPGRRPQKENRMQDDSVNNKIFIKTIKALQLLFNREYREGGWLPGGREMAKRLGVSHSTYRKALDRLEQESFVRSFPRKGHYVIACRERCHKIGLVLRDGSESPFLEDCESFASCVQTLHDNGFEIQLIQSTRPEQLHENAVAHGVDGLIWFKPSRDALPYVRGITESGDFPQMVVCGSNLSEEKPFAHWVAKDYPAIAAAQTGLMLARNYRKVLVVGYASELWTREILGRLVAGGIRTEFFESRNRAAGADELKAAITSFHPSCVISCNGATTLNLVFDAFAGIPSEARPALLLSETEEVRRRRLAERNIPFMVMEEDGFPGQTAAEILVDHMIRGIPLRNAGTGVLPDGLKCYPAHS